MVRESTARLEVGLDVSLEAFDDAVGLWVGRLAETPVDLDLPTERGKALRRPSANGVPAPSRTHTSTLGGAPNAREHVSIPQSTSPAWRLKTTPDRLQNPARVRADPGNGKWGKSQLPEVSQS